jgi:hypothetical protein
MDQLSTTVILVLLTTELCWKEICASLIWDASITVTDLTLLVHSLFLGSSQKIKRLSTMQS